MNAFFYYATQQNSVGIGYCLKVIKYPSGNYLVEKQFFIPEDCCTSTREEFENEFDNAMSSFQPFFITSPIP